MQPIKQILHRYISITVLIQMICSHRIHSSLIHTARLTGGALVQIDGPRLVASFPFISSNSAVALLRIATACLFMAHALVRIANGTIPRFGQFMESVGFPNGLLWVWAITLVEIIAGTLMIAGRFVRWAALALFGIAAGGIVLIHRNAGWFVGEHGTGGQRIQRCSDCDAVNGCGG
jgi:putative oxidoreductase